MTVRWWGLAALLAGATAAATRTAASQGKPPFTTAPYHAVRLADGVFVVPGDTGRGSEGRPNAGFVVTDSGVVVIDALASPLEARRFRDVIRTVTPAPVRWVVLTHHHPDHMMGTIVFTRDGARVIAHPDRTMQTRENGDEGLLADWDRIIGLHDLQGFAFADTPTWPITHDTTLVLGHTIITLYHPPGAAHTPGDLAIWLPATRVLFAGDLVVEDGVTMVVDGNSGILATALAHLDSLGAAIVVPGHGRADPDPRTELAATEHYIDSLRLAMRAAVRQGTPMTRILRQMPRPDSGRPVSLASRRQRNAERVYLEMERELMGMGSDSHGGGGPHLSGLAVTARLPAQFPAQSRQSRNRGPRCATSSSPPIRSHHSCRRDEPRSSTRASMYRCISSRTFPARRTSTRNRCGRWRTAFRISCCRRRVTPGSSRGSESAGTGPS